MTASRQLTVLHVAPTPFFSDRGCHLRIRGIVRGLDEYRVRSVVCTYPIGEDVPDVRVVRTVSVPGYRKKEAGPSPFKYIADILMVFTVARQIRKQRPDVLHCHLHEGVLIGWLARIAALKWRMPIVFDVQGSLTGELEAHGYIRKGSVLYGVFAWAERIIVRRSDVFVCSSESSARMLSQLDEIDRSLIHVVPDGTDVDLSTSYADVADQDRSFVALYSGGLTESKGLSELMKIIRESDRRKSKLRFIIVGYPTEKLHAFVMEHGLAHRCEIVGRVSYRDLPRYFKRAGLAIEPKMSGSGEASGKLLNYMAGGLPVVCFETDNNNAMLGGLGFFVPLGDIDQFVDRMEECALDPDRRKELSRAGVKRVHDNYSWSRSGARVLDAYRSVDVLRSICPNDLVDRETV